MKNQILNRILKKFSKLSFLALLVSLSFAATTQAAAVQIDTTTGGCEAGTCTVLWNGTNSNYDISGGASGVFADADDLTIGDGSTAITVTFQTNAYDDSLKISPVSLSNFTVAANAVVTVPVATSTTYYSLDFVISSNAVITGTINVDGKGYIGSNPGSVQQKFGMTATSSTDCTPTIIGAAGGVHQSGGSHGGAGLAAITNNTYGNINSPTCPGAGGGTGANTSTTTYDGGSGGGAVILNVAGTLSLGASSIISADGAFLGSMAGAGAGGSINLTADSVLIVSGANIGANGTGNSNDNLSGGGRISVNYTTSGPLDITGIEAFGGLLNSSAGAAGTIYINDTDNSSVNDLYVDNGIRNEGSSTVATRILSEMGTVYNFANLYIDNSAFVSVDTGVTNFNVPNIEIIGTNDNSPGFFVGNFVDISNTTTITSMGFDSVDMATVVIGTTTNFDPVTMTLENTNMNIAGGATTWDDTNHIILNKYGYLTINDSANFSNLLNGSGLDFACGNCASSADVGKLISAVETTLTFASIDGTNHPEGSIQVEGEMYVTDGNLVLDDGIGSNGMHFELKSGAIVGKSLGVNLDSFTIESSSSMIHPLTTSTTIGKIDLTVNGDITINGTINVDGRGYLGSNAVGNSTKYGMTATADCTPTSTGGAGGTSNNIGASHGGLGWYSAFTNKIYGSVTNPICPGAGGGGQYVSSTSFYKGGSGGGVVILNSGGTLSLGASSSISVDGSYLGSSSGAGAGGSINLTANSVNVIFGANISADGSSNSNSSSVSGGGRIAINYTLSGPTDITGIHAYGGLSGGDCGAAGTIYIKDTDATYGDLYINNNCSSSGAGSYTGLGREYSGGTWIPLTADQLFQTVTASNYGKLAVDITNGESVLAGTVSELSNGVILDDLGAAYTIPGLPSPPPEVSPPGPLALTGGNIVYDNTPTFTFDITDGLSENVNFQIQIDNFDNTFSSLVLDYTSGFQTDGTLSFNLGQAAGSGTYAVGNSGQTLADGGYYWRVRSTNQTSSQTSAWIDAVGASPAFYVVSDDVIQVSPLTGGPTLADPTPVFMWNDVTYEETYTIEITDSSDVNYLNPVLVMSGIAQNSTIKEATSSLSPGSYIWRVYGIDGLGTDSSAGALSQSFTLNYFVVPEYSTYMYLLILLFGFGMVFYKRNEGFFE